MYGSSKKKRVRKNSDDYGRTTADDIVRSCCLFLRKPPTRSVVVYLDNGRFFSMALNLRMDETKIKVYTEAAPKAGEQTTGLDWPLTHLRSKRECGTISALP